MICTDPSGSFVFSLGAYNPQNGNLETTLLYGLAVDQTDGSLAEVPGSPYSEGLEQVLNNAGLAVTQ